MPWARGGRATPSSICRAICARASKRGWRPMRTNCAGWMRCPRSSAAWCWPTRCSTRCRCNCWPAMVVSKAAYGMGPAGPRPGPAPPPGRPPPVGIAGPQDYLTEIHTQGEGFIRTLADRLERGAVFLLDYGFGASEYYHPQPHMGTVMCHQGHLVDSDPLLALGRKDITAHVNFSALALTAQEAGLHVLGYTTQAHFLLNCGLLAKMELRPQAERAPAALLVLE